MEQQQFEFRGNAREWFGIWIVNILLSIVTLGIYSAWAKVRTKKYFYQNTWVAGRNFDYHATGKQILKGRLVVIAAIFVYALLSAVAPPLAILMLLAYLIFIPVLVKNGMVFNARNSSWANVRFNFEGQTGEAYKVMLGLPILVALTAYTTFPFLARAVQRFGINGHRLGKTAFHFESDIGPFYKAFLLAVVFFAAIGGLLGILVFQLFAQAAIVGDFGALQVMIAVIYVVALLLGAFAVVLYQSMIRNHVYANTTLGPNHHGFRSTVTPGAMLWLAVSNALVVASTLGLMLPWAQIRAQRYLAANSTFLINGSLEEFTGEIQDPTNAIGDALGDIEGVELGLAM